MLDPSAVAAYTGPAIDHDAQGVTVAAHPCLAPHITRYRVCLPGDMPAQQIIVPTASATLVYAIGGGRSHGGLRGVGTRAVDIAAYARRFELLVLIEFSPAGLYPFLGLPQADLLDASFAFADLDTALDAGITEAIEASDTIGALAAALDALWLSRLHTAAPHPAFAQAMAQLTATGGRADGRALAQSVFYSEKQLGRLFRLHLGASAKTYGRILRLRGALPQLAPGGPPLDQVAAQAGYWDASHLARDLARLCGVTPGQYARQMSFFYNDPSK